METLLLNVELVHHLIRISPVQSKKALKGLHVLQNVASKTNAAAAFLILMVTTSRKMDGWMNYYQLRFSEMSFRA